LNWLRILFLIVATLLAAGCRPTRPPPPLAILTPTATSGNSTKPSASPAVDSGNPPATSSDIKRGGILKALIPGELGPLDPFSGAGAITPMYQIYEPFILWRPNQAGKWGPAPGLVASWEVKPSEITFKLPMHVIFHDGSNWNADAAVWNLERYRTDARSRHKMDLECIERSEKIDDYSFRLKLRGACASVYAALSQANVHPLFPVSRVAVQKWGPEEYSLNPTGTGPFAMDFWMKDSYLRLKRWDAYWHRGADAQSLPYLEEVMFKPMIDDSQRIGEVRKGEAHITEMGQGTELTAIKATGDVRLLEGPWIGNAFHIVFNSKSGVFSNNNRLRQAVLTSIDREALAKDLGRGTGIPLRYIVLPGSLAYDERVPSYKYDVSTAQLMMREAGYPNGIDFNMDTLERPFDDRQAKMLANMWEGVRLRSHNVASKIANWANRVFDLGQFEASTVSVPSEGDPALDTAHYFRGSSPIAGHRFPNQDLDRCLAEANGVLEPAYRREIYSRCQQLAYNDAYRGFLWAQTWNWVIRTDVKGLMPSWGSNWELSGVWLDN
jgi:peptide/nickel transport system substrate-binding protein